MQIYINSSGVAPEHDYRWMRVDDGDQAAPPLLDSEQIKVLREEERFSVVLVRSSAALGLLATGLKTDGRSDYTHRLIRNTVACISDTSEERVIRGIAVSALQGELDGLIDQAVQSNVDVPLGFEVSPELIDMLSQLQARDDLEPEHLENRIGKNSLWLRQDLAEELNTYKLPERDGVLIVVTTLVAPARFIQAQVWRGLSDMIKEDITDGGEHWLPLPLPPENTISAWQAQFLDLLRFFWDWVSDTLLHNQEE